MPHRRLPNSTPAVLRTLKTARDTYKNTPNAADRAISAAGFAQLDDTLPTSLLNRFSKEASDVDIAQAEQAPLTNATSQAAARLTMLVSHFHQVFDLGITRGTFVGGARSYYGRTVGASAIPDLTTYAAVEEAAEAIVSGEASRQQSEGQARFVAMANPSADEVATALATFQETRQSAQQAQVKADQQSEELQALYPAAHDLAVDIIDTVEFFYRKDPAESSRRAKAQRWGVVYIYDDGTAVPPEGGGNNAGSSVGSGGAATPAGTPPPPPAA